MEQTNNSQLHQAWCNEKKKEGKKEGRKKTVFLTVWLVIEHLILQRGRAIYIPSQKRHNPPIMEYVLCMECSPMSMVTGKLQQFASASPQFWECWLQLQSWPENEHWTAPVNRNWVANHDKSNIFCSPKDWWIIAAAIRLREHGRKSSITFTCRYSSAAEEENFLPVWSDHEPKP